LKIAIPKEIYPNEKRIPIIPQSAKELLKLGALVEIEQGMGLDSGYPDEEYVQAGAKVITNRDQLLSSADMILRLRKPAIAEIDLLKEGAIHISYLDPFKEKELIEKFILRKISAISMELIPRITKAQKMDALSSQANLAGYVAVIMAADKLAKVFPMMMTPAGTIAPSKVFVIGAGVAGLQAIATAKRLGARVEAFDTREVVEEQVLSLGAKFVKIDLGETGQTKDGYAKTLTEEQLQKQREVMAKHCAMADIVISTAQVFGKKAPVIVTRDLVEGMKPGSVIVDLAVEGGGNVQDSKLGEEVIINQVYILGFENLPGKVAVHASQMYSSNLLSLISEFWDKETNMFQIDLKDEILQGCLITHQGNIISETYKSMNK
jgi:NAD(P) transhydrogenase subunit alpha